MKFTRSCTLLALVVASLSANAAQPIYEIFDMGIVGADTSSQGTRVSNNGTATGRSLSSNQASAFTLSGGGITVGLPKLTVPSRTYHQGNGINGFGDVVGVAATTFFGSNRLPVMWKGGLISQVPMPAGQTSGQAWDITDDGRIVGSINGGSLERAFYFDGTNSNVITSTTPAGQYFVTAYGISENGIVVGQGWDPVNAAITVGMKYDANTVISDLVPPVSGDNSVINFDISGNGTFVTGTSSINGGSGGKAFIWSEAAGTVAVPIPSGSSSSIGRGVNNNGWTVGNSSSAFSVPWVNDGFTTYKLADVINNYATSGWNLLTNTSSSALGINDSGAISGTGVKNGLTRGYVMRPKNVPITGSIVVVGGLPTYQGESISVILKNRGGQTNQLARYPNVALTASGEFSFNSNFIGLMTITVKGESTLAKALGSDLSAAGLQTNPYLLINGDGDGDNEVGPGDFELVVSKFGLDSSSSEYVKAVDLDRDGEIGPSDFEIVVGNFGLAGDEF